MRILVVGAGATGGYFGGRLAQAGRDVTFLVREGRARTLRERGLRIVGLGEQTVLEPRLVTADTIDGPYDLILVTVKESGLTGAVADLAPAVGPDTLIVPVLNGMRQIDVLVERFGEQAVLGGIAYVMTTIDADGDILRLAGMHRLAYGRRDGSVDDQVRAVHAALSDAGFDTALSERILGAMWSKWTFIAALGAVCVLGGGTVGEVGAVPGGTALAEAVLAEAASVAAAAGHPVSEQEIGVYRGMLTAQGSDDTSSLFRDLSAGLPVEAEQIFGDLVARAEALDVAVPSLAAVAVRLRVHNARVAKE
ncbi:2-dehydropantoate 2-reductase [Catenulispora acidiphila DSM 44928]|uniref:2-dehydropantoate 2-reductase n=1 Tax=Catenulispora acidiphila (strain DSM 44928 / JCM 14897 / NBRC 102108 / NRRL B-24433 / ID139908) TaxID=479433 RepID=C7PXV4_CATAD|nr:ketopantoate reductase family protein [Catenulispora acidiphila]ACU73414.1 2-dehydropantoate 2-reductase [Catenulispora acidiphila DSM 44928]